MEGQGYKTIGMESSPILTHIPNLKGLREIFFELLRPEENPCGGGGGGVTGLNPKYPRLCLGIQILFLSNTPESSPFLTSALINYWYITQKVNSLNHDE